MVWYDDKLKFKLEEFYKLRIQLMQINDNLIKLHCLPSELLENESFENILKNHEYIRLKIYKVEVIKADEIKNSQLNRLIFWSESQEVLKLSFCLIQVQNQKALDILSAQKGNNQEEKKNEGRIFKSQLTCLNTYLMGVRYYDM